MYSSQGQSDAAERPLFKESSTLVMRLLYDPHVPSPLPQNVSNILSKTD
jgi:hypothetical protein